MSIKQQKIEWDVPLSEVQVGIPIGYEIEFSLKSNYNPILYKITTWEETRSLLDGQFLYSLDNGLNWIQFPRGNGGQIFTTAYKIRLIVNIAEFSSIYAESEGTIYRIRGDGSGIISTTAISDFQFSDLTINSKNNDVLAYNGDQDIFILNSELKKKSNIGTNDLLGIAADGSRNLLWLIKRDRVSLRSLQNGNIFEFMLPTNIDNEFSSSSSTSLSSSSSSYSSSSSSSGFTEFFNTENLLRVHTEEGYEIILEEP